ncbi:MAG: glycosyltransferase, partial [Candidatus Latescibacteria bacterium]|nr:glycosyltransferase [Candidatus Latescibacterota bacterium]NIO77443.1 glycosyltransferase [Candidatus Latescibacterota bacterium]
MGVDLERFSSGKRARLRDNHDLIILFVGRLVESKGVRDLLRAFSLLPDSLRARTSVWLIGAGKHLAQLQQDARVL